MRGNINKLSSWMEFNNQLWDTMKEYGEWLMIAPGESPSFFQQGFMFFIVEGELVLFITDGEDNEKLLMVLGEGALVGEVQLFTEFSSLPKVKVTKPTLVRVFSQEMVLSLIRTNPELLGEIARSMLDKMNLILEQIEELVFCSAAERLLNTLSRLNLKPNKSWPVYEKNSGPSHQELAQMIGVHRVTVSRLLATLRKEGLSFIER